MGFKANAQCTLLLFCHSRFSFQHVNTKGKAEPLFSPNAATSSTLLRTYIENPLKADDTDPKNLLTTTAWEVGEWGGHHNIKKTSGIVL